MDYIALGLFFVSICCAAGKNIFSKGISVFRFGTKKFFLSQFLIFLTGAVTVLLLKGNAFTELAFETVCYAIIFAILLISAQWFLTVAMSKGNVAICVTVYSLGFIVPTITGIVLWDEKVNLSNTVGIILVAVAVIVSAINKTDDKKKISLGEYIVPLMISAPAGGFMGVIQTLQQKSAYSGQLPQFVVISFSIAMLISFIGFLFAKKDCEKSTSKKLWFGVILGACYGCVNMTNTLLAGRLDASVFFPAYNISNIFVSSLLGVLIFKERITKREVAVFVLTVMSILLLNVN